MSYLFLYLFMCLLCTLFSCSLASSFSFLLIFIFCVFAMDRSFCGMGEREFKRETVRNLICNVKISAKTTNVIFIKCAKVAAWNQVDARNEETVSEPVSSHSTKGGLDWCWLSLNVMCVFFPTLKAIHNLTR